MRGRLGVRGIRVWLPLSVLFLLAGAVAVAVPLLRGAASAGEPDAASATTVHRFACAEEMAGGGVRDGYCRRIADDLGRRGPLADSDRTAARPFLEVLRRGFVDELGADCPDPAEPCRVGGTPEPEAVRRALLDSGFPSPVVRLARITDPAPLDTVLYAVRVGHACLLGYVQSGFAAPALVVGLLRDGTCLSP